MSENKEKLIVPFGLFGIFQWFSSLDVAMSALPETEFMEMQILRLLSYLLLNQKPLE